MPVFNSRSHDQQPRNLIEAPLTPFAARALIRVAVVSTLLLVASCGTYRSSADEARPLHEKSIDELRSDLDAGKTSSVELVRAYLQRIDQLDRQGPQLQAIIALNPNALEQARELDRERQATGPRGPLHGIPILIKDNIESADPLPTTAGSLALANNLTRRDAPIVANLRSAGAIILGKANLSEWANYRSTRSVSGWSGVGGLTKNPHVLDRTPCGSSSGSGAAAAARFAAATIGTETDGSITCPAAMNGVVGLKPTVGLLSQERIVPIAHSQDAPGPMGTSVADIAVVLAAMVGDKPVCADATPGCKKVDYVAGLSSSYLTGKRVGVLRFKPGRNPYLEPVYDRALAVLREAGATLIEVEYPDTTLVGTAESTVLSTEFKHDLNAYLATTPPEVQTRSLDQLIEFNNKNARELSVFGQERMLAANATAGVDDPAYKTALADSKRLAGPEGIMQLLASQQLDLLVAPTTGAAGRVDTVNGSVSTGSFSILPAVSGYPHLTVPMGASNDLPLGMSFIGPAWSEAMLLAAGYAFEVRANALVTPRFKPSLETGDPRMRPAP